MDIEDIKRQWRIRYRLLPSEPTTSQLQNILAVCPKNATVGDIDQAIRKTCQTINHAPSLGVDRKDLRDVLYELSLEFKESRLKAET